MKREKQKELIAEAMADFFRSETGEGLIGNIVIKAMAQHLNSYEWEMERHHKDGTVQVETVRGNVLSYMSDWLKNTEGAIRGAQADAGKARNRAGETLRVILAMAEMISRKAGGPQLIEENQTGPMPIGPGPQRKIEEAAKP